MVILIIIVALFLSGLIEMVNQVTWDDKCCRCEGDVKLNLYPGKRACHLTCGSCLYPDNVSCVSCEIVGHCTYALANLKAMKRDDLEKGCYFKEQLTGEENLYQILNFVNGQRQFINSVGEKEYLENLKKANNKSPCIKE